VVLLPLLGLTGYAWALAALVVGYAGYAVYQNVVAPMSKLAASQRQASGSDQQNDRAAKRAARRRQKWN
jgi:SRP-independent targeting protein 2/TMEM208